MNLIEFFKPDVRILGEDYIGKPFTGDDLDIKVIYTTRSHDWSTTKVKDLITLQTLKQNPEIITRMKMNKPENAIPLFKVFMAPAHKRKSW